MADQRLDLIQVLNDHGKTQADLCRSTDINYKRLNGIVQGYWYASYDEERRIAETIREWTRDSDS